MANWVNELRSGKHGQTTGRLKDSNGNYCCMGVMEEHTLNIPFADGDFGPESVLSGEFAPTYGGPVAKATGLDTLLTESEITILEKLHRNNRGGRQIFDRNTTRTAALGLMNDNIRLNFVEIALLIEIFGWNVEYDPEFYDNYERKYA